MTDVEVKAALADLPAVACTLYGEARSEGIAGLVFVGSVIRNRVLTPKRFGTTYKAVCLAKLQFSCWWPAGGQANYELTMARARMFSGDYDVMDAALKECVFVAAGIIDGRLRDNSRSSNHYMTKALFTTAPPKWAIGKTPVVQVGSHVGFIL